MYVYSLTTMGSAWSVPVIVYSSSANVGRYVSLSILNDWPYVAYYDSSNDRLKFCASASSVGDSWHNPHVIASGYGAGSVTLTSFLGSHQIAAYAWGGSARFFEALDVNGTSWAHSTASAGGYRPQVILHNETTFCVVSYALPAKLHLACRVDELWMSLPEIGSDGAVPYIVQLHDLYGVAYWQEHSVQFIVGNDDLTFPTECTYPTSSPTMWPTDSPSMSPTMMPTHDPTAAPTMMPTNAPTAAPIVTVSSTDAHAVTTTIVSYTDNTVPITTTSGTQNTLNMVTTTPQTTTTTSTSNTLAIMVVLFVVLLCLIVVFVIVSLWFRRHKKIGVSSPSSSNNVSSPKHTKNDRHHDALGTSDFVAMRDLYKPRLCRRASRKLGGIVINNKEELNTTHNKSKSPRRSKRNSARIAKPVYQIVPVRPNVEQYNVLSVSSTLGTNTLKINAYDSVTQLNVAAYGNCGLEEQGHYQELHVPKLAAYGDSGLCELSDEV